MVLGPTESQALHPPTPTEHGTTGWGGTQEPLSSLESSLLCTLFPHCFPAFSIKVKEAGGHLPPTLYGFSREGQGYQPQRLSWETPGHPDHWNLCSSHSSPAAKNTPIGVQHVFPGRSDAPWEGGAAWCFPTSSPTALPPQLSTQQTSLPKAASSSLLGTVPGKKSPCSLSSHPGLNFPAAISSLLFNPTQLGTHLTASVSIVCER